MVPASYQAIQIGDLDALHDCRSRKPFMCDVSSIFDDGGENRSTKRSFAVNEASFPGICAVDAESIDKYVDQ